MKNVLIINCGSSSLKYKLIDMEQEQLLCSGLVERIGMDSGKHIYKRPEEENIVQEVEIPDHDFAIKILTDALIGKQGVIKNLDEINAVGHRVVHAGEKFSGSVLIDDEVIAALEACIPLAPLHNPPNLTGIMAAKKCYPMYRCAEYLTQHFIKPCRKVHTSTLSHMSCMRNMLSVVMDSMEPAIVM